MQTHVHMAMPHYWDIPTYKATFEVHTSGRMHLRGALDAVQRHTRQNAGEAV